MHDIEIAKKYLNKARDAERRGIIFDLSFTAYKNLARAKKCAYTGIALTDAKDCNTKGTDRTIERIDNNKGYISGNVCAVCYAANNLKSMWENPGNPLSLELVKKMINNL